MDETKGPVGHAGILTHLFQASKCYAAVYLNGYPYLMERKANGPAQTEPRRSMTESKTTLWQHAPPSWRRTWVLRRAGSCGALGYKLALCYFIGTLLASKTHL